MESCLLFIWNLISVFWSFFPDSTNISIILECIRIQSCVLHKETKLFQVDMHVSSIVRNNSITIILDLVVTFFLYDSKIMLLMI
jgi:hypothetical protein